MLYLKIWKDYARKIGADIDEQRALPLSFKSSSLEQHQEDEQVLANSLSLKIDCEHNKPETSSSKTFNPSAYYAMAHTCMGSLACEEGNAEQSGGVIPHPGYGTRSSHSDWSGPRPTSLLRRRSSDDAPLIPYGGLDNTSDMSSSLSSLPPTSHPQRRPSNRDEFDGPSQFLEKPEDSGYEPKDNELPTLPVPLYAQEKDEILSHVNDRLSQCAFDFIAKYQFPIPIETDKGPVCVPNDREWSEWVPLLKRLATKPDQRLVRIAKNLAKYNHHILNQNKAILSKRNGDARHSHRRGRGQRRNDAYWVEYDQSEVSDPFDGRECLFSDDKGRVITPAMANLDTGLKVPGGLVMSRRYAKELGKDQDISKDFDDPCLRSISGHLTPVSGILRSVVFRLKGSSVTFKRDFFICDAIDDIVDIMFGASFIKDQFALLFDRMKSCISTFATWFSTKKETTEERAERERREAAQKIKANQREMARLKKETEELEATQQQTHQKTNHRV